MLCMITQACMMYQSIFWSQNLAGPLTIANWACKIPKSLSMSFLAAVRALWKSRFFLPSGFSMASQMFATLSRCHLQDSSHSCMYGHLLQTAPVAVHHLQSYSSWWSINNVDVIQRSRHSKKACQIQVSWSATVSRIIVESFFGHGIGHAMP